MQESLARQVAAELELAEVRSMMEALKAEKEEGRRRLEQLQEQVTHICTVLQSNVLHSTILFLFHDGGSYLF